MGKRLFALDDPLGQGGIFEVERGIFHNMDVAARSGRDRTQEIAGNDHIGGGAADPASGIRCDPAGTVGAKPAADPLQAEPAFDRLILHPVMGGLHWQRTDVAFERLVRTLTGVASITLVHKNSSFIVEILQKNRSILLKSAVKRPQGAAKNGSVSYLLQRAFLPPSFAAPGSNGHWNCHRIKAGKWYAAAIPH